MAMDHNEVCAIIAVNSLHRIARLFSEFKLIILISNQTSEPCQPVGANWEDDMQFQAMALDRKVLVALVSDRVDIFGIVVLNVHYFCNVVTSQNVMPLLVESIPLNYHCHTFILVSLYDTKIHASCFPDSLIVAVFPD